MLKLKTAFTTISLAALAFILVSIGFPAGTSAQLRDVVIAEGFDFNKFADQTNVQEFGRSLVSGPTAMAFDARGRLFVATLNGKILILLDNDDNGVVDEVKIFSSGIPSPLGLEFRANGDLFLTSSIFNGVGRILRMRDLDGDDVADETTVIVDGLPSESANFGGHQTDRLKFGPDGLLYFGQGSATDNGAPRPGGFPEGPLNATVLRVDVDAASPAIDVFAKGLRNPFGMAFHPANGELFTTDGGSGEVCQLAPCPPDTSPPEEVNWVVAGGNYGFPKCEGTPDAANPDCAEVRAPIAQFSRHLTPTSLAFYTGPQAGEFKNHLLVTLFKRLIAEGGDLRRLKLEGDAASGFRVTENEMIASFNPIDPFDGPIETAIDPISGDIYVARLDVVPHRDGNEHHNIIYRIHRAGSDALPFIGPVHPSSAKVGSGALTISVIARHLKPGAVISADGQQLSTRQGRDRFELVADLPATATAGERTISIEVKNPDGARSNAQPLAITKSGGGEPGVKSPRLDSLFVYKKKKSRVISPVRAGANAKKLRLVVNGADFDADAQLIVNGVALEITSAEPTELIGKLTNALLEAPGELIVEVRNSTGKISNKLKLAVVAEQ